MEYKQIFEKLYEDYMNDRYDEIKSFLKSMKADEIKAFFKANDMPAPRSKDEAFNELIKWFGIRKAITQPIFIRRRREEKEEGKVKPKILNATPHDVVIYREEDTEYREDIRKLILKEGAEPVTVIPKSGTILSIKTTYIKETEVDGIPIFVLKAEHIDPVPEGYDIVIVSNMYATYALQIGVDGVERLYTVSQPVYDSPENPRPVGCLGLNKVVQ